jgi:hypothetical protein
MRKHGVCGVDGAHSRSGQWFVLEGKLLVSPFVSDIHLRLGDGPLKKYIAV